MENSKQAIFKGNASEYFGIWITNLFLTIITFGIYSPWAKVINTKYLYQNLNIDSHRFDYIAQPMQILKGRLLALFLLIVVSSLSVFNESIYFIALGALFLATPWIINKSMSFQLRMTTYRNVSFDFQGNYLSSFLYFILLPYLSVLTLFLALPLFLMGIDKYIIMNTKFGNKEFVTNLSASEYYRAFFAALAGIIAISVIAGTFIWLVPDLSLLIIFAGYIGLIAIGSSVWGTIIRNHTFNNSKLLGIASFKSTMEVGPYTFIVFTNILALIFSLGLASPWVAIRNMKYLSSTLWVETEEGLNSVIDDIPRNNSAILDEVAGAFDIDI
tara:strand:+ start:324 stop:1310 length:987 start_codon:yes stop_codon:yes gene_type:complete